MSPFKPAWRRRSTSADLLFRYAAGDPITALGGTFTRSTTATYFDSNGVLQTAAINTLRDGHYVGGVRTTLLEGARTNSCLWSRDLTNAAWAVTGTGTRTQNAVGLDGTSNSATTIADTDAAASTAFSQAIVVPVDTNTHTLAYYIKKDTDQTRFPLCYAAITGGTTVSRGVYLNTQTGAILVALVNGTGAYRVVDGGLWWIVEITLTNNASAGNTSLTTQIDPAFGTVMGTNNAAATGSCVVGQVQVELNSAFYSSPILTTTVALPRGADTLLIPISFNPQSLTIYTKFIESGTILTANAGILNIGNGTPNYAILWANGSLKYEARITSTSISAEAAAPALGNTVELRNQADAAGICTVGQSIGGAAETLGAAGAGQTFPAAWSGAQSLYPNGDGSLTNRGFAAFQSLKITAGVRSLAEMRAL